MSSSSRTEIFRRTSLLFKSVDALKGFIFHDGEEGVSLGARGGLVLRSLNEFKVRKLFGEAVYGAGLQSYLQGRVLDKRFSSDTLSGKVDETGRKWLSDAQFFEPTMTLEGSGKIHVYGYCACNLAVEGSLCQHMAALMTSWVRKPEEFEKRVSEKDFESAKGRVVESIKELVDHIEKDGSSRSTDLEVLQRTYSKLKLWTEEIREAGRKDNLTSVLQFSNTINDLSLALISAIENKYQVRAVDLYNRSTVSTFGKALDLLSSASRRKPSAAKARSRTARSWDKLLDGFTK